MFTPKETYISFTRIYGLHLHGTSACNKETSLSSKARRTTRQSSITIRGGSGFHRSIALELQKALFRIVFRCCTKCYHLDIVVTACHLAPPTIWPRVHRARGVVISWWTRRGIVEQYWMPRTVRIIAAVAKRSSLR